MFKVGVTADVKSNQAITINELNSIIEKALENHKIGELTVKKDDFYELVAIKGNFIM